MSSCAGSVIAPSPGCESLCTSRAASVCVASDRVMCFFMVSLSVEDRIASARRRWGGAAPVAFRVTASGLRGPPLTLVVVVLLLEAVEDRLLVGREVVANGVEPFDEGARIRPFLVFDGGLQIGQ